MSNPSKLKLHILVHYQGNQHRLLIEQADIMDDDEFDQALAVELKNLFATEYPSEKYVPQVLPFVVCPDFSKINKS